MRIRNKVTGTEFEFSDDPLSRSHYRFRLLSIACDRVALVFGLKIYFLTLTLNDDSVEAVNKDLNKFLNFLRARFRRAGLKFFFVWVVELQKKRYRKFGVKALHWHFAIVCPDGALPHCKFDPSAPRGRKYQVLEQGTVVTTTELFERWGKGQVFSMRAYSHGVYGYLSKYFTKEYEHLPDYNPAWSSLRWFGSSQFGVYRFPGWAFDSVQERIATDSSFADFEIRKEGARINFYGFEFVNDWNGHEIKKKVRVESIRSPWSIVAVGSSDSELPT